MSVRARWRPRGLGSELGGGAVVNLANVLSINATGDSGLYNGTPPTFAPDTSPLFLRCSARPGFDANGNATTYNDLLVATRRSRNLANYTYPSGTGSANVNAYLAANLTATGFWLHDYAYTGETWVGSNGAVTNNSTLYSPKPVCQWVTPRGETYGDTAYSEIVAGHRNTRYGREIACARMRVTDSAGTVAYGAWVSTPTISTYVADPVPVEVYASTVNISGLLNNGVVRVDWEVKPWIGSYNATPALSSVADTYLDPGRVDGFTSNFGYRNASAGAPVKKYAYLAPTAGGTLSITGATVSGNTVTGTFSGTGTIAVGHYFTSGTLQGRAVTAIVDSTHWTFGGGALTNATPTTYTMIGGDDTATTGGIWHTDPTQAVLRPFNTFNVGAGPRLADTVPRGGLGAGTTWDSCEIRHSPLATAWTHTSVTLSSAWTQNAASCVFLPDPVNATIANCTYTLSNTFSWWAKPTGANRTGTGFSTWNTEPPSGIGFRFENFAIARTTSSGKWSVNGFAITTGTSVNASNVITISDASPAFYISAGCGVTSSGAPANTYIVKQLSGTPGGGNGATYQCSALLTGNAVTALTPKADIIQKNTTTDLGSLGSPAAIIAACRMYYFGNAFTGFATNEIALAAGAPQFSMFRGCTGASMNNSQQDLFAMVGCVWNAHGRFINNNVYPIAAPGTAPEYDVSGGCMVSCKFLNPTVGLAIHNLAQTNTVNGFLLLNNLQEPIGFSTDTQANSSQSWGVSVDASPQQSVTHFIDHGCTWLGCNYAWRDKIAYNTDAVQGFTVTTNGTTTITVTAVTSGNLTPGSVIVSATSGLTPGWTIVSQLTIATVGGPSGGTGTYQISNAASNSVSGITMQTVTGTQNATWKLQSFIGVISESMSTKGDVFACGQAQGTFDPRCNATYLTGNQAILNGVGYVGCVNLTYMGLDFGTYFGREYLGLGCVAGADQSCQVHYNPQFVSYQAARAGNWSAPGSTISGTSLTMGTLSGTDTPLVNQGIWFGTAASGGATSVWIASGTYPNYTLSGSGGSHAGVTVYTLDTTSTQIGGGDYRLQSGSPVKAALNQHTVAILGLGAPLAYTIDGVARQKQAGAYSTL